MSAAVMSKGAKQTKLCLQEAYGLAGVGGHRHTNKYHFRYKKYEENKIRYREKDRLEQGAILDTVVRKELFREPIFELKLNGVEERPW